MDHADLELQTDQRAPGQGRLAVPAEVQDRPAGGVLEFEVVTFCNCLQTNAVIIKLSVVKEANTAAASIQSPTDLYLNHSP